MVFCWKPIWRFLNTARMIYMTVLDHHMIGPGIIREGEVGAKLSLVFPVGDLPLLLKSKRPIS